MNFLIFSRPFGRIFESAERLPTDKRTIQWSGRSCRTGCSYMFHNRFARTKRSFALVAKLRKKLRLPSGRMFLCCRNSIFLRTRRDGRSFHRPVRYPCKNKTLQQQIHHDVRNHNHKHGGGNHLPIPAVIAEKPHKRRGHHNVFRTGQI